MKSDDTPMYDDPSESAFVRDLLQAGRRANVEYDVERGLAKHLATISAGSTAPYWLTGATAAKRSLPLWVGYVSVPLVAAGVAGLLWLFSAQPDSSAANPRETSEIVAPAPAVAIDPASPELDEAASEPKQDERAHSRDRRSTRPIARPSSHPPARAARPSATLRGPSEAPAVAVAEGSGSATSRGGEGPDAVASNPYSGSASASHSGARDSQPSAPVQNHAPPRAPEPVADPTDERAEPEAQAEDEAEPAAKQRAAANRPIVDESRLEREMQMLAVTQRVLASDPERALRLSQQGEREFPETMFSAERRQLGLLALVKLGRLDEARREGRPFLARYPKAPWSERLRRALATGQVE